MSARGETTFFIITIEWPGGEDAAKLGPDPGLDCTGLEILGREESTRSYPDRLPPATFYQATYELAPTFTGIATIGEYQREITFTATGETQLLTLPPGEVHTTVPKVWRRYGNDRLWTVLVLGLFAVFVAVMVMRKAQDDV